MHFSKFIHWLCERSDSITLFNATWLVVLHIAKQLFCRSELANCVITIFTMLTAVLFVIIGLFFPVAGIIEIKKMDKCEDNSDKEVTLFLRLVIMPPIMAFDTILCALDMI